MDNDQDKLFESYKLVQKKQQEILSEMAPPVDLAGDWYDPEEHEILKTVTVDDFVFPEGRPTDFKGREQRDPAGKLKFYAWEYGNIADDESAAKLYAAISNGALKALAADAKAEGRDGYRVNDLDHDVFVDKYLGPRIAKYLKINQAGGKYIGRVLAAYLRDVVGAWDIEKRRDSPTSSKVKRTAADFDLDNIDF